MYSILIQGFNVNEALVYQQVHDMETLEDLPKALLFVRSQACVRLTTNIVTPDYKVVKY